MAKWHLSRKPGEIFEKSQTQTQTWTAISVGARSGGRCNDVDGAVGESPLRQERAWPQDGREGLGVDRPVAQMWAVDGEFRAARVDPQRR